MKSNPDLPATFGFRDGVFYTSQLLHVALLRALGFRAERLTSDTAGTYWFKVEDIGRSALTLEQAVEGIHDPRRLSGTDAEKVAFFKLAQEHYRTAMAEVKHD